MAVTPVTAVPFTVVKPFIRIGDATTGYEIECSATHVTAEPSQDENTVETFCGVYTSYSSEQWVITFTVAMSYGAAGFWNLIRPLCNTKQQFAIRPDQATVVGPGNPEISGLAFVKAFSFMDADPGGTSEVDVVLGVQGKLLVDTGSGPAILTQAPDGDAVVPAETAAA